MLTIEERKQRKKEYMKTWRKNNKEAIAEHMKTWRKNNKEAILEKCKEYRKNNREAIKEGAKEHYKNNREAIIECAKEYYKKNKEAIKEHKKEYRKNNKEALTKYAREWNKKNKELKAGYVRKWEEKNKEVRAKYYKEYRKNRYHTDPNYKMRYLLIKSLRNKLKRHLIKETNPEFSYTKASSSLLGCTLEEVKTHIENQFEDGMTWENWTRDGWHLDHIVPCSSFDLTKNEEQEKCFHYTNLQPLWAKDNLSKGSKLNWSRKELVI